LIDGLKHLLLALGIFLTFQLQLRLVFLASQHQAKSGCIHDRGDFHGSRIEGQSYKGKTKVKNEKQQ
jgi:hypothetical protein